MATSLTRTQPDAGSPRTFLKQNLSLYKRAPQWRQ